MEPEHGHPEHADLPAIRADEVLVQLTRAFIARQQDNFEQLMSGSYSRGISCSGKIMGIGSQVDPKRFRSGLSVIIEPYSYCRSCANCEMGQTNLCQFGRVLNFFEDGDLLPWLCVPQHLAHVLDGSARDELLLTACAASVTQGMIKANILPGDSVLIIGDDVHSFIGSCFARSVGSDFVGIVARTERNMSTALLCGASCFWSSYQAESVPSIHARIEMDVRRETNAAGADVVVYTNGYDETCLPLNVALDCLRPGGSLILARSLEVDRDEAPSLHEASRPHSNFLERIISKQIRFIPVWGFSSAVFKQTLEWLRCKVFDVSPALTNEVCMRIQSSELEEVSSLEDQLVGLLLVS